MIVCAFGLLENPRILAPAALATEATEAEEATHATDAAAKANFLELETSLERCLKDLKHDKQSDCLRLADLAGDGIEPMSALLRRRKEVQQISTACSNCRTGAVARGTCAGSSTQIYRFLQGSFLFRMFFRIEQQLHAMAEMCTCACLEVSCLVDGM